MTSKVAVEREALSFNSFIDASGADANSGTVTLGGGVPAESGCATNNFLQQYNNSVDLCDIAAVGQPAAINNINIDEAEDRVEGGNREEMLSEPSAGRRSINRSAGSRREVLSPTASDSTVVDDRQMADDQLADAGLGGPGPISEVDGGRDSVRDAGLGVTSVWAAEANVGVATVQTDASVNEFGSGNRTRSGEVAGSHAVVSIDSVEGGSTTDVAAPNAPAVQTVEERALCGRATEAS